MADPKFKFTGDEVTTFCDLKRPDGRSVELEPGEEFEVGEVLHPHAVLHELLEPLNAEAKKAVAVAKKADIEEAAEPAEADVVAHDATVVVGEIPPA